MLIAAHLQFYLLAQATISSSSAGILHAHGSTSTSLQFVPAMGPLQQTTPINYRAMWSLGNVPPSGYVPILATRLH
ncbi:hypothetical protein DY000_02007568 [Brassica cretica]|uniref:Secreted protein n=1 Tax=Brassica cretica TaxID=69181 RepID=A0ABQ7C5U7_BRACR|nr:hypothetical protein DY000_02007568 [Brassica cretica]